MLNFFNQIILSFKKVFSNKITFGWFVMTILGFLCRRDFAGVSSFVRTFFLESKAYYCFNNFFKSDACKDDKLKDTWTDVVDQTAEKKTINGRYLLVGDGMKRPVEGKKMPAEKHLHTDSQNSGKKESFIGHFFGAVGIILGKGKQCFCTLLRISIQEGNEVLDEWAGKDHLNHIEQTFVDAHEIARKIGDSYLILDRFFLSKTILNIHEGFYRQYGGLLHLIMRAKSNIVAYEKPEKKTGPGRSRKKGKSVKIFSLFDTDADSFKEAYFTVYGKKTKVRYLVRDYLWGQGLYTKLRFVLTEIDGKRMVLVSTDLSLSARSAVEAYCYRAKIEETFKSYKHTFGGHFYHFWSKKLEKFNRYTKNGEALKKIKDKKVQKSILKTFREIHRFVLFSAIAQGTIQMACTQFRGQIDPEEICYLRTYPEEKTLSEGLLKEFCESNLLGLLALEPQLEIGEILERVQQGYSCLKNIA